MSTKPKQKHKNKEEIVQEERMKKAKAAMDIHNAKYLPEVQIPVTGAEFSQLKQDIKDALAGATQTVFNDKGEKQGFTLPDHMVKLSHTAAMIEAIHKDNYENGLAIKHQDYMAEMERRAKVAEEQAKSKAEITERDIPQSPAPPPEKDGAPSEPAVSADLPEEAPAEEPKAAKGGKKVIDIASASKE